MTCTHCGGAVPEWLEYVSLCVPCSGTDRPRRLKSHKARPPKPPRERKPNPRCATCGEDTGRTWRKYCLEHRPAPGRNGQPTRPPPPPRVYTCADCGVQVPVRCRRCLECQAERERQARSARRQRHPAERPCVECGTVFRRQRPGERLCSDACREVRHSRSQRASEARVRAGTQRAYDSTRRLPGPPGMSVEDWLAERRPAWAREPSTLDAWAGYSSMGGGA